MIISEQHKRLLALLQANSRASVAELARKLGLSRSTVKDHIQRLQKMGVITGFTVRLSDAYLHGQLQAHVLINLNLKKMDTTLIAMKSMPEITAIYAVNGIYDQIAIINTDSTHKLDQVLDKIGTLDGVEKTVSSIILSTKLER